MRFPALGVLCAGILGVASGTAQAAIIEQSAGVFDAAIAAFDPIGQSFVATDSLLGSIAFAFSDINPTSANDPVTMTLYDGAGVAGSVLTSVMQTLPAVLPSTTAAPVFIDFDFTGTSLTIGNTYTAAVTTGSSFKIAVVYNGADAYASGMAFESAAGSLNSCSAGCDLNFRVTPSAVPVPAAAWLFGSGLVGLLSVSRKRRG